MNSKNEKEETLKTLRDELQNAHSEDDVRAVFFTLMMRKDITSKDIEKTIENIPFPKEIDFEETEEETIKRK